MLRPEMKLFEHSEFSSQALLLIRFQTLYFSQIPEWNKDPTSRISVPFYPGNSEYFPVFLNSSSFRQIRILTSDFYYFLSEKSAASRIQPISSSSISSGSEIST